MFWSNTTIITHCESILNKVDTLIELVENWLFSFCPAFHIPCRQEVCPDVDGFVVHLEAAEDAVQRWAPRVTVPGDDAVLPEHLKTIKRSPGEHDAAQNSDDLCGGIHFSSAFI